MKIHFLNVGHGDCCIIEFDSDRTTMIDINNAQSIDKETKEEIIQECPGYNIQLTNPVEYMEGHRIDKLFRFVITHPHMDHISGINEIAKRCQNVWLHQNSFPANDELSSQQRQDWKQYELWRKQIGIQSQSPRILSLSSGACNSYYKEDGILILSPTEALVEQAISENKPNIMSTVLLIQYGKCKILLGGDAEAPTWEYILENYESKISNVTILKAAHHGRNSGYYQEAVSVMKPEYTIVSVGKKPEQDATNKYRNYSRHVYSTRWKGNIVFDCHRNGTVCCNPQYDR